MSIVVVGRSEKSDQQVCMHNIRHAGRTRNIIHVLRDETQCRWASGSRIPKSRTALTSNRYGVRAIRINWSHSTRPVPFEIRLRQPQIWNPRLFTTNIKANSNHFIWRTASVTVRYYYKGREWQLNGLRFIRYESRQEVTSDNGQIKLMSLRISKAEGRTWAWLYMYNRAWYSSLVIFVSITAFQS